MPTNNKKELRKTMTERRVEKPWGYEIIWAETKDYVAIASEFQAMAHLPGVNIADIFEPQPGIVYSWGN